MKFKWNQKTGEVDPVDDMPDIKLSDQMVRRDNYFHNCWMLLKQNNPAIWQEMTEVELTIAGYEKEPEKEDNDGTDTDKQEGVIV